MLKVAIIIGSTRPGRKAEAVARWVYDIASKRSDSSPELLRPLHGVQSPATKSLRRFPPTRHGNRSPFHSLPPGGQTSGIKAKRKAVVRPNGSILQSLQGALKLPVVRQMEVRVTVGCDRLASRALPICNQGAPGYLWPVWVKRRKPHSDYMFSGLHPIADLRSRC